MLGLAVAVGIWMALAMAGAWALQRATDNSGWVDAVWSFATGLAGVAMALVPVDDTPLHPRQWLVAALIAAWALRLGSHIARRSRHGPEDARYAAFRRDWGADFQRRLFWFLQAQAVAGFTLALAVLVTARNPTGIGPADGLAVAVIVLALLGEAIADGQLRRFRANPANRGLVCEAGLWGWSRHPNYFFEWLLWLALPLLAIDPAWPWGWPWGWVALIAPAMMYHLLVNVSGIPPLEATMLASRGDAFRDYQARVSAFVPLPPRRRAVQ